MDSSLRNVEDFQISTFVMSRNFRFLHICYVDISEISPHDIISPDLDISEISPHDIFSAALALSESPQGLVYLPLW